MTFSETISLVGICISGAGTLVAVITGYYKLKAAGARRTTAIVTEMSEQISALKHYHDVSIQRLNGMLSYVIHAFDRPAWVKVARMRGDGEIEFRMLEMNEPYASTYGIPREQYIGKTDIEAGWPKQMADAFRQHDLAVWASGEPTTFTELMHGKPMRYRKLRVQTSTGELKGIFGYAVDCESPVDCPVWKHTDKAIEKRIVITT